MPEVSSLQDAINAVESFASQESRSQGSFRPSTDAPVDRGANTQVVGASRNFQSKELRDASLVQNELETQRANRNENAIGERFKGRVISDVF